MQIGEIAAATSGNENLLSNALGMLQHRDAPSAFGGFDGAHQPRGAGAENYDIKSVDQGSEESQTGIELSAPILTILLPRKAEGTEARRCFRVAGTAGQSRL